MPHNQVLIPVDRSPFSLSIVPHVKRFLDPKTSALTLLHVAEEPTPAELRRMGVEEYTTQLQRLRGQFQAQVAEELQPLTDELQAAGFAVTVAVSFGEPITQIEHYIGTHEIDLLAMSTHGRSGFGRVLFGSVAQELLQQLSLPILLLRPIPPTSA
ncbi:MAG TPA: universal stress protein [Caldilineaceae bacterium]|nr:universal stress protein [Caldilineaceae bacterium]